MARGERRMGKLKASIGIMSFEGAERCRYILRSLYNNTYWPRDEWRIVYYDDGSSKETQEKLRFYRLFYRVRKLFEC